MLYTWNEHNIVYQLYLKRKNNKQWRLEDKSYAQKGKR